MTAITSLRLQKLRDLAFSPKGEQTDWAHEFDAELRQVQLDLDEACQIQDEANQAAQDAERVALTAAGADLLDDDPDARPNAAEAETVRRELVSAAADAAEIDRLRGLLKIEQDARRNSLPLERFARAAFSIARAIEVADEDSYWLPAEYLSEQFSALARLARALDLDLE